MGGRTNGRVFSRGVVLCCVIIRRVGAGFGFGFGAGAGAGAHLEGVKIEGERSGDKRER